MEGWEHGWASHPWHRGLGPAADGDVEDGAEPVEEEDDENPYEAHGAVEAGVGDGVDEGPEPEDEGCEGEGEESEGEEAEAEGEGL